MGTFQCSGVWVDPAVCSTGEGSGGLHLQARGHAARKSPEGGTVGTAGCGGHRLGGEGSD